MQIATANIEQIEEIVCFKRKMITENFAFLGEDLDAWANLACNPKLMKERWFSKDSCLLTARDREIIGIGSIYRYQGAWRLSDYFVSRQRQGIGTKILDRHITWALADGASEVTAAVYADNPAIEFWEKHNFIKTRPDICQITKAPFYWLSRSIS
jgi:GNAT superfamily N-acetyltransferase